jgi:hypothetical protein
MALSAAAPRKTIRGRDETFFNVRAFVIVPGVVRRIGALLRRENVLLWSSEEPVPASKTGEE